MASDNLQEDTATDKTPLGLPELTSQLLQLAAIDTRFTNIVDYSGPPTVLPSSFRITDAAQALVAATSIAVAQLAEIRTDGGFRCASVTCDSVETSAAFQSERHLRMETPVKLWDELGGHYQSLDGHIQFHTNFPHHRDAVLAAADCAPDATREQLAAVVETVGRFEMEQRVGDAGGIAAALRTVDEWQAHPHRAHIETRPPLILTNDNSGVAVPLGAAPPDRPLAGLRVLDFTRVIAGPVCTRTLAAYGADVLRIGAPDLPVVDSILPDTTLGKRFANADITNTAARDAVLRLVAEADVVVIGFRPGALAGYGLGPDELFAANPNLVLATMSAFGNDGPWGGKRGFDSITQTATGIVSAEMAAFGSDRPRPLPCQLLDHGTGFLLALGVLSALARRHHDGGRHTVDASLITTRNWLVSLGSADPQLGSKLTKQDLSPLIENRSSVFGQVTHVRHPGQITGVPAIWEHGPSKPGQHRAAWLDRL